MRRALGVAGLVLLAWAPPLAFLGVAARDLAAARRAADGAIDAVAGDVEEALDDVAAVASGR